MHVVFATQGFIKINRGSLVAQNAPLERTLERRVTPEWGAKIVHLGARSHRLAVRTA